MVIIIKIIFIYIIIYVDLESKYTNSPHYYFLIIDLPFIIPTIVRKVITLQLSFIIIKGLIQISYKQNLNKLKMIGQIRLKVIN